MTSSSAIEADYVKALRHRATEITLFDIEKIDTRLAAAFQAVGTLRPGGHKPASPELVTRLEAESSPRPILFFDRESGLEIVATVLLLLHDDRELRSSAARYFAKEESRGRLLGQSSWEKFTKLISDVESGEEDVWRPSSIGAYDIVCKDALFNFSGIEQCLENDNGRGVDEFLGRVLSPDVDTLHSLGDLSWAADAESGVLAGIQEIVSTCENLAKALDCYCERYGFLPLSPPFSASSLVERWLEVNPNENVVQVICEWASPNSSVVREYHRAEILLALNDRGSSEIEPLVQSHFTSVVSGGLDVAGRMKWSVLGRVAALILQSVEVKIPGSDSRIVGAAAWMIADRLLALFGRDDETLSRFNEAVLVPSEHGIPSAWEIARPPVQPSLLRYLTLGSSSIWAHAILVRAAECSFTIPIDQLEEDASSQIRSLIVARTIEFPRDAVPQIALQNLAFESTIERAESLVSLFEPNSEARLAIASFEESALPLISSDKIATNIKSFSELSRMEAAILVRHLRAAAYCGGGAAQAIDGLISSRSNWKSLVGGEHAAIAAIVEIALEANGRGIVSAGVVAHALVGSAEQADSAELRSELATGAVILATAAEDSGPLERLRAGSLRREVIEYLPEWKSMLENAQQFAPFWLRGRFGRALAHIGDHS